MLYLSEPLPLIHSYYCFLTPDTTLTPDNLFRALSTVKRFWLSGGLLSCLGVPCSKRFQNRDSEDDGRMTALQYYLQTLPGVSWARIAGVLWYLQEHRALEAVRKHLPGEYMYIQSCSCIQICPSYNKSGY